MESTTKIRDRAIVLRESEAFVDRLDKLTESLGKSRSDVIRMAIALLDHEVHGDLEKDKIQKFVEHHTTQAIKMILKKAKMKALAEQHHNAFRNKKDGT